MNSDRSIGDSLTKLIDRTVTEYGVIRAEHIIVTGLLLDSAELSKIVSKFLPHVTVIVSSFEVLELPIKIIRGLKRNFSSLPLVAALEHDNPQGTIELLKSGITDFITLPFSAIDILPRLWRILRHSAQLNDITYHLKQKVGLTQLVGKCSAFIEEISKIPFAAKCDASVLITGETGTGKELCARAIHYLSMRADKPFVPVNCGAIPADLVENELFGHTRGAFTGADSAQGGLIAEAEGGTLFLDEIDCLPLASQPKLLRLLQEKEYRKLGSPKTHGADIRVISATNIDLETAIRNNIIRKDLYYRVNIIPISLPSLRERKMDIPILSHHFLRRYAMEFLNRIKDFTPKAMSKLLEYDWPGNVRELENVIQRAVVFCKGDSIDAADIALPDAIEQAPYQSFHKSKSKAIADFEKKYIKGILLAHKGNISRAAKAAEKDRRAFWELIRKHNIDVKRIISEYNQ
jgi:two-component system, NtrC family, response regulator GlrR